MSKSEKHPPLTCQELSKQCNDVHSSSSMPCGRWIRKSLRKNVTGGLCQPSMYKKVSVGSVSETLEHCSDIEPSGTRFYKSRLEELSKELEMLDDRSFNDDDDDDDDEWGEDWDNCQRGGVQSSVYRWLPNSMNNDECSDHLIEQQDFLDEIESTLHTQVDGEIEVFRSNLHSMIHQQQDECRQLWNQELEESFSKMIPSNIVSVEQSSSPCQTVPHNSSSQDTWSSEFVQNSSDQQKIEAMSTSTSSIHGDEGSVHFVPSLGSNNGSSLDGELNRLTLQLLSSALTISNALHREEYAT